MQKVKVQDGVIQYVATDPTLLVDFSITGQANVSKQLNVGDDPLAAGNITTPSGTDLQIIPGNGGDLSLAVSNPGLLKFNNAVWPSGALIPDTGMYIGASAANVLQYYPFTLDFTANDALTVPQLNAAYPTIQPGQRVVGNTVIYECVAPSQWRIIGGGGSGPLPVNPTEVVFGDAIAGDVISSPELVFDVGTTTLTVGTAQPGLITSEIGQPMTIEGDTGLTLSSTNGVVSVAGTGNALLTSNIGQSMTIDGDTGLTLSSTNGVVYVAGTGNALVNSDVGQSMTIDGDTNLFLTSTNGSVAGGNPSLPTSATAGFFYIPITTGTPTGVPTGIAGMAPMVVDSTGDLLYIYVGGAWKSVLLT